MEARRSPTSPGTSRARGTRRSRSRAAPTAWASTGCARWGAYGGQSNLGDRSFETFTWATGLLAYTRRIQIFSTFHVPVGHPVLAAKMGATADHVSGGRWGLNIVAGWFTAELAMFGVTQREHDERYEVADEWAELLSRLWTETEEFDHRGRFRRRRASTWRTRRAPTSTA